MTGISVGVTIPIPGHTPVLAGLITATTPIGGILTGEAIIPIGGIIPAGEAAITTTRPRRTIGPTSYTALPTGTDRERDRTSDRPVSEGAARVV